MTKTSKDTASDQTRSSCSCGALQDNSLFVSSLPLMPHNIDRRIAVIIADPTTATTTTFINNNEEVLQLEFNMM